MGEKKFRNLLIQVEKYSLAGFIVTLSFSIGINNIFLIPVVLCAIVYLVINKSFSLRKIEVWVLIPLILTCAGSLWSTNPDEKLIINYICLSIVPYILIPIVSEINTDRLFLCLIIGGLLALVICLTNSFYNYIINDSIYIIDKSKGYTYNIFQYSRLSFYLHPTYMSLYINLAASATLIIPMNRKLRVVIFITFGIFLFLISSKIGILAYLLLLFVYTLGANFSWLSKLILISSLIISLIVILKSPFFIRVNKSIYEIQKHLSLDNLNKLESSTAIRIQGLKLSRDLITEKPLFGYGTISTKYLIKNRVKEDYTIKKNNIGIDGEFLEATIMWGLIGLFFYIFYFYKLFHKSLNHKRKLYLLMIPILTTMLSESITHMQKGLLILILVIIIIKKDYFENKETSK